jgi:hypothetical protein
MERREVLGALGGEVAACPLRSLAVQRASRLAVLAAVAMSFTCVVAPALGDKADKAGWSTETDARNRLWIKYVPVPGGPHFLTIGCLNDADMFVFAADGIATHDADKAILTLTNGQASFDVSGEITTIDTREGPAFISQDENLDTGAKSHGRLRNELLPLLRGSGPIVVKLGMATREVPIVGLAESLRRFVKTCLDRQ